MNDERTLEERLELIIRRTKENDATASRTRIRHAFDTAAKLHEGVERQDGTQYIDHPVSVADIVASNGGDQTMVIAALLHDTVEDTAYTLQSMSVTFGQDVADIVDALTKVEANIPEHIDGHRRRLIKNYIDGLSHAKLLDPSNPQFGKAIYIKLADRLHNMRTLGACSKKKQSKKASDTLQFFVPLARLIGSKYFERELSELCFGILEPDLYEEISTAYEEARSRNSRHISSFMKTFDLALRKTSNGNQPLFRKVSNEPFKCYQIKNLLGANGRPYSSLGSFSKSAIYLYEIVLEYQEQDPSQMLPRFIELYLSELRQNEISIQVEFKYPSNTNIAFDLTDALSNRYLVLLKPSAPMSSISDYSSLFPPDASLTEMPESFITVFSKDGKPYQMAKGATVLDFAFRIHPDLGCSASHGLIRRSKRHFETESIEGCEVVVCGLDDVECEIDYVLQDSDCVFIVDEKDSFGKPKYRARYEWFNYAKTKYARDHLIEFFEKVNPVKERVDCVVSWEPVASIRYH